MIESTSRETEIWIRETIKSSYFETEPYGVSMIGVPQNDWFIMEKHILTWMRTGGTHILGNLHMGYLQCDDNSRLRGIRHTSFHDNLCWRWWSAMGMTTRKRSTILEPEKASSNRFGKYITVYIRVTNVQQLGLSQNPFDL